MIKWPDVLKPVRLRRLQRWAVISFAVALPISQAITDLSLGIGLVVLVLRALQGDRPPWPRQRLLNALLLLWFVAALCSMQNSVAVASSVKGLQKLLFKYFGLYLLVVDTIDSVDTLRSVALGCLAGLSLVVVDGLWQAVFGKDLIFGTPPALAFDVVKRVNATFNHPADLAIYLVSAAPLAVALSLAGNRRRRPWMLTLVVLTSAVVLLSRTRGGFLGFLLSLLVLAVWLRRLWPAAVAVIVGLVQMATVPPAVQAWAATMPSLLHQLTQPERLMYWETAGNMIHAHPVIGVGINTFVKAYAMYRGAGDHFTGLGPYAHNMYLHQAAEMGLLGLAVLSVFIGRIVWMAQRSTAARSTQPLASLVCAGLGAGLLGYVVIGCLESSLFYARGSMIFWFLAGWIVAAYELSLPPPVFPPKAEQRHHSNSVGPSGRTQVGG